MFSWRSGQVDFEIEPRGLVWVTFYFWLATQNISILTNLFFNKALGGKLNNAILSRLFNQYVEKIYKPSVPLLSNTHVELKKGTIKSKRGGFIKCRSQIEQSEEIERETESGSFLLTEELNTDPVRGPFRKNSDRRSVSISKTNVIPATSLGSVLYATDDSSAFEGIVVKQSINETVLAKMRDHDPEQEKEVTYLQDQLRLKDIECKQPMRLLLYLMYSVSDLSSKLQLNESLFQRKLAEKASELRRMDAQIFQQQEHTVQENSLLMTIISSIRSELALMWAHYELNFLTPEGTATCNQVLLEELHRSISTNRVLFLEELRRRELLFSEELLLLQNENTSLKGDLTAAAVLHQTVVTEKNQVTGWLEQSKTQNETLRSSVEELKQSHKAQMAEIQNEDTLQINKLEREVNTLQEQLQFHAEQLSNIQLLLNTPERTLRADEGSSLSKRSHEKLHGGAVSYTPSKLDSFSDFPEVVVKFPTEHHTRPPVYPTNQSTESMDLHKDLWKGSFSSLTSAGSMLTGPSPRGISSATTSMYGFTHSHHKGSLTRGCTVETELDGEEDSELNRSGMTDREGSQSLNNSMLSVASALQYEDTIASSSSAPEAAGVSQRGLLHKHVRMNELSGQIKVLSSLTSQVIEDTRQIYGAIEDLQASNALNERSISQLHRVIVVKDNDILALQQKIDQYHAELADKHVELELAEQALLTANTALSAKSDELICIQKRLLQMRLNLEQSMRKVRNALTPPPSSPELDAKDEFTSSAAVREEGWEAHADYIHQQVANLIALILQKLSELTKTRDATMHLQELLGSKVDENKEQKAELHHIQQEVVTLRNELLEKSSLLTELQCRYDETLTTFTCKHEELAQTLAHSIAERSALLKNVDELTENVVQLSGQIDSAKSEAASKMCALEAKSTELLEASMTIARLEEELVLNNSQLTILRENMEKYDLGGSGTGTPNKFGTATPERSVSKEVQKVERKQRALELSRIFEGQQRVLEQKELDLEEERFASLRQVQQLHQEIELLTSATADRSKSVEALTLQCEEMANMLSQKMYELELSSQKVQLLEQTVDAINDERNHLQQLTNNVVTEITTIHAQLVVAQQTLTETQQALLTKEEEVAMLLAERHQLREQIQQVSKYCATSLAHTMAAGDITPIRSASPNMAFLQPMGSLSAQQLLDNVNRYFVARGSPIAEELHHVSMSLNETFDTVHYNETSTHFQSQAGRSIVLNGSTSTHVSPTMMPDLSPIRQKIFPGQGETVTKTPIVQSNLSLKKDINAPENTSAVEI